MKNNYLKVLFFAFMFVLVGLSFLSKAQAFEDSTLILTPSQTTFNQGSQPDIHLAGNFKVPNWVVGCPENTNPYFLYTVYPRQPNNFYIEVQNQAGQVFYHHDMALGVDYVQTTFGSHSNDCPGGVEQQFTGEDRWGVNTYRINDFVIPFSSLNLPVGSYNFVVNADEIPVGSYEPNGGNSTVGDTCDSAYWDYDNYQNGEIASDGLHNCDSYNSGGSFSVENFTMSTPTITCNITSFTADNTNLPSSNSGTTLRFSFQGSDGSTVSYPWNISLLSGSVVPSPSSGNNTDATSQTGSLSTAHTYRLNCNNGDLIRDLTVNVQTLVCQDPTAENYNQPGECTWSGGLTADQICQDPAANNYQKALPCTYTSSTGTLTGPSSCKIGLGASSCNVNLNWSVANPASTSTSITAVGMANRNYSNVYSGTDTFAVPYSARTFYLYNNGGSPLAQIAVGSDCGSGNTWSFNTGTCVVTPVNGACGSTHYSCISGTSVNNVSGSSSYTWGCNGLNGGTSTSSTACSEAKSGSGTNTCANGALNYPTCTTSDVGGNGPCLNGATNPPICTTNGSGSCLNGATNPPTCTINSGGICVNGATNPSACNLFKKQPFTIEQ